MYMMYKAINGRMYCTGMAESYADMLAITGREIERIRYYLKPIDVYVRNMETDEWTTMYDHECKF